MKLLPKILISVLIFSSVYSFSQKKIKVTAEGEFISRDLTIEQTKEKAIDDAKRNALINAGVSEAIQVSDFLYQFEDNEKFREIFQGFTSTETGGEVLVEEILSKSVDIDEDGNMIARVEIMATVYKHKSKKDPAFDFSIEGIDEFYDNNAFMKFAFIPARHGFLKIFNVNEYDASVLYPYSDPENNILNEPTDILFEKDQEYIFPVSKLFDERGYETVIARADEDTEYNLLIFVFTKYDKSFREQPSVKTIMNWIYDIPMEDRAVQQIGFVIRER